MGGALLILFLVVMFFLVAMGGGASRPPGPTAQGMQGCGVIVAAALIGAVVVLFLLA